jgi:hypothetical protein
MLASAAAGSVAPTPAASLPLIEQAALSRGCNIAAMAFGFVLAHFGLFADEIRLTQLPAGVQPMSSADRDSKKIQIEAVLPNRYRPVYSSVLMNTGPSSAFLRLRAGGGGLHAI